MPATSSTPCPVCGTSVLRGGPQGGRPRRFCSDACRAAAYRRRRVDVDESLQLVRDAGVRRRGLRQVVAP